MKSYRNYLFCTDFQELDTCKMKLVSTGGLYDEKTRSFYGKPAKEAMKKYNVDLVLLGCKGLIWKEA